MRKNTKAWVDIPIALLISSSDSFRHILEDLEHGKSGKICIIESFVYQIQCIMPPIFLRYGNLESDEEEDSIGRMSIKCWHCSNYCNLDLPLNEIVPEVEFFVTSPIGFDGWEIEGKISQKFLCTESGKRISNLILKQKLSAPVKSTRARVPRIDPDPLFSGG